MEILCFGSLVEFVNKINTSNIATITTSTRLPTQEISIVIKIFTLCLYYPMLFWDLYFYFTFYIL